MSVSNSNPLALPASTTSRSSANTSIPVELSTSGLFDGREFRTYIEFTTNFVIKIVVPVNILVQGLDFILTQGEARIESVFGGTEGGSFSTSLPVFSRNSMSTRPTPIYAAQTVLTTGGTHTGGVVLDVLINKTATNANFASGAGGVQLDDRGIGAGTYYFRITVVAPTVGLLKFRWQERP